ncbi:MAG: hypothetical protein ISS95_00490 [Candidatus Aenigmarchaeota archaeon]|nr:hypothetical protein [Candidatus Aenigmarchaeota archaeon]
MGKYTFPISNETMVTAKSTKRISTRSSQIICKKINNTNFKKTKKFVEGLIDKTSSINGKFYTKVSEGILEVLKQVEANANNRGFDPDEMKLRISAHQGPKLRRGRRKSWFGSRIKVSHIHAVLEKKEKKPAEKKIIKKKEEKK